jgi:hypothetical protein
MRHRTHHDYEEAEAREEEFVENLERRHRDNPAFWAWVAARHQARMEARKLEVTDDEH